MNRIQFFTVTGLSTVFALLVIGHIALSEQLGHTQTTWAAAQQEVNKAQISQNGIKQLAARLYQDAQRTNDAKLKDLLAREQITFTPANTNATETPAAPTR